MLRKSRPAADLSPLLDNGRPGGPNRRLLSRLPMKPSEPLERIAAAAAALPFDRRRRSRSSTRRPLVRYDPRPAGRSAAIGDRLPDGRSARSVKDCRDRRAVGGLS